MIAPRGGWLGVQKKSWGGTTTLKHNITTCFPPQPKTEEGRLFCGAQLWPLIDCFYIHSFAQTFTVVAGLSAVDSSTLTMHPPPQSPPTLCFRVFPGFSTPVNIFFFKIWMSNLVKLNSVLVPSFVFIDKLWLVGSIMPCEANLVK